MQFGLIGKNLSHSFSKKYFEEKFKKENLYDYLLKENINYYSEKVNKWEIQPKDFTEYKEFLFGKWTNFGKLNNSGKVALDLTSFFFW